VKLLFSDRAESDTIELPSGVWLGFRGSRKLPQSSRLTSSLWSGCFFLSMKRKGSCLKQEGSSSVVGEKGQKVKSLILLLPLSTFFTIPKSHREKRRRE